MPKVRVTTEDLLALDAALGTLSVGGERLPAQYALTLARLHRVVRVATADANAALAGFANSWGQRNAAGQLQASPNGGVAIAAEHQEAFRKAERELMQSTHEVEVPEVRLSEWPAHGAPSYALVAALLPFLSAEERGEGAAG